MKATLIGGIIGMLVGLLICLSINTVNAYYIGYRIIITVKGREVYREIINKYEYDRKWKYIVSRHFREDLTHKNCRIPAEVEVRRMP